MSRSLRDYQAAGLADSTIDQDLIHWVDNLDTRCQQETAFAIEYVRNFGHGTSGHLAYVTLYRMAIMLEQYRQAALGAQGR